MTPRVVIVGGGQGGYQAAASLRTQGFDGEITLIGDEPHLPYQRPPLSKGFLLGKQELRQVLLRPASFYETHRIDLRMGERVASIDRTAGRVTLTSGREVSFDFLVLATGARNRLLPMEGSALDGVCYLRSLTESTELRQRLETAREVAIIGGGFIGLEVAAAARALGKTVTILEGQPRLMARVAAPVVSEYVRATHAAEGVQILLDAVVARIEGSGSVNGVVFSDGRKLPADLVIVGIGIVPNNELAAEAGLTVANGIVVDEHLRTNDDRIFAIGDCAEFPSIHAGARVRLESVQNAVDHATAVAKTITGHVEPYTAAPWFWTDQFDMRMQMTGIGTGADCWIVRGDPESRKFSVFYFAQGELRAVDSINRPADHLAARKLIAAQTRITPEQAADEGTDLRMLLSAT